MASFFPTTSLLRLPSIGICILFGTLAFAQPTTPSSNITFSNINPDGYTLSWTSGDGANRIIVARQGSAVTATPTNGTTYTASSIFGSGDAISSGQFVVYNGNGSSATVIGLSPSTVYHFAIYEYNGLNGGTAYLTTAATASRTTVDTTPSVGSEFAFKPNSVMNQRVLIKWVQGSGSQQLLVARAHNPVNRYPQNGTEYSASSFFGQGSHLGDSNFVIAKSSSGTVTLKDLTNGVTYYFAIFELNGSGTTSSYKVDTFHTTSTFVIDNEPTVAASNTMLVELDGTMATLKSTPGDGSDRLVVFRANNPVNSTPADGAVYSADSTFGNGDELSSGNYVVYAGPDSVYRVYGLSPETRYYVAVFEYNNDSGSGTDYLALPFDTVSFYVPLTALPVSLLGFDARQVPDGILLEWATTSETDNEGFHVMRSYDGHSFERIGFRKGRGTTSEIVSYDFLDNQVHVPLVIYYQLLQQDFNGKTEASPVVAVRRALRWPEVPEVWNTLDGRVVVQPSNIDEPLYVSLYSTTSGQLIARYVVQPGNETFVFQLPHTGNYVVHLQSASYSQATTVAKP